MMWKAAKERETAARDARKRWTRAAVLVVIILLGIFSSGCAQMLSRMEETLKNASRRTREGVPRKVKKQLRNGMTVVVEENFSVPVVAVQVWVNVGSGDETESEAGLSHKLEHMLFKGTKERPAGEMAREVESLGGDLNAFTSYDRTVYHITIASRYFEQAMELLADQVQNSVIDAEDLAKEKEVVLEEIRRSQDSPSARIYKYLFAESYTIHPYRRPVIGYEKSVKDFTVEQVRGYYRRWYVPANLTLVVAGDVRAEEVFRTAERYFGRMPGNPPPAASPRTIEEPPRKGVRARVYWEDVSDAYLYLSFPIPAFQDRDIPALDLLSVIAGSGDTSRLHHRLVTERHLVNRIFALSYTPLNPGLFVVGSDLEESKAAEALEMILKQLYLLKHEPVAEWELAKAKIALETDAIFSRETVEGQARRLGYFLTYTGDPDYEKKYLEQVRAVTREDLIRVANRYFNPQTLTVTAILPQRVRHGRKKKEGRLFDEERIRQVAANAAAWDKTCSPGALPEIKPIKPPEIPQPEPTPSSRGASAPQPPRRFTLSNGIRVIVRENYTVPLVAVNAVFEGGVRREKEEINGINSLIARTITEGTARYSGREIHSKIEARGGHLLAMAGRNALNIQLEVPSTYFRSCLPLLADVIRYPTFPEEEVSRMQGILISSIRNQMDHPGQLVNRLFREALFQRHPFRLNPLGTEASVKRLSREDLQDYYETFALPDNLVIAVVGDVDADELQRELENLFSDWKAERYTPASVPLEPPPREPREVQMCRDISQSNIIIGFQGTTIRSSDRYPLQVLSQILSGISGRLFTTLRSSESLAYQVYSFSEEGIDPGIFGVYIGTAPEKEAPARQRILEELRKVREQAVSKDELQRAQQMLIGDYEIGLQKYVTQAVNYSLYELYGLGYEAVAEYPRRIQMVSVRDVHEAAQHYLRLEAPVTALVRPCEPLACQEASPAAPEGDDSAAFTRGN